MMSEKAPTENAAAILVKQALEEYQGALIGYAASILGDVDRARDVVQDTFLRLWQQDTEKVADSLKSWLFTVCRNRAFDILRKEKRMTHLESQELEAVAGGADDPAEAAEREESHRNVLQYLERLPENQREVIRLKFQGDLSYKEISAITNLSVGNVGFLLHTGIRRLREMLARQPV